MPWEDILNDLRKNVADRDFMEIPRPAECLKYILKVHLNVAGLDLKKTLKQLYVRPYVLVQLLYVLIDNGHEVFRGKGCAEALKEQMRAAVEREYPETEGHLPEGERQGAPPQPIIQALRAVEAEAQTGDAKEADAMCRPLRKRIRVNADKKCHARRWCAQYRRVPYRHTSARRLARTEHRCSFGSRYTPGSRLGACRGSSGPHWEQVYPSMAYEVCLPDLALRDPTNGLGSRLRSKSRKALAACTRRSVGRSKYLLCWFCSEGRGAMPNRLECLAYCAHSDVQVDSRAHDGFDPAFHGQARERHSDRCQNVC